MSIKRRKLTYDMAKDVASQCKTRNDFQKKDPGLYNKARKEKWMGDICGHMIRFSKPKGYWNDKQRCHKEALMYNNRSDFQKGSRGAYKSARINGWLDEICSHMKPQASLRYRFIYSYEFKKTNSVYVGLTVDVNKRNNMHLYDKKHCLKSAVYLHIKEYNLSPNDYELVVYDKYEMCEASGKEGDKLKEYVDSGWRILNRIKTGGLGGNINNITYEVCKKEALKYNTRIEFYKGSQSIYNKSLKMGWLDEICRHMIRFSKPKGYWNNKQRCHKEALKYNNRIDFQKGSKGAYLKSMRNGWLDDICSHMITNKKPKGYWNNKQRCHKEALKYNNRIDFQKGSKGAYLKSMRNGWLDDICSHMITNKKPKGYWTYDTCKKEALKYNNRIDFQKGSSRAYELSRINKWLDEFFPK